MTGDVVTLSRDEYDALIARATGWENACRAQAEKSKQLEEEYKKIIEKQTREIIALRNNQQEKVSVPDEEDYSWAQFE